MIAITFDAEGLVRVEIVTDSAAEREADHRLFLALQDYIEALDAAIKRTCVDSTEAHARGDQNT